MDKEKDKIIENIYKEDFDEEIIDTDEFDTSINKENDVKDRIRKKSSVHSSAVFVTIVIILAFIFALGGVIFGFLFFV